MVNKKDQKFVRNKALRVCVNNEEKDAIESAARMAGNLSVSTYLRRVGLGQKTASTLDQRAILELSRLNSDQGRLGGLLKMWLTNEERFDPNTYRAVNKTLNEIEAVQATLISIVNKL